jgi:tRNA pseudouridine32 synthase/23S rRNA pseudouridine746 synthase/23S rRNA pseudouridine1911/1915/1917 synthase
VTSEGKFRPPPKKYQPRGLSVIYEDRDIIVVDKVAGLLTVGTDRLSENTAYRRLTSYVRKGNPKSRNRLFIVHRLDRDTSGILVFAKTFEAKQYLQEEWHSFSKKYCAIVRGTPAKKQDILVSHLCENRSYKVYSADSSSGAKLAKTGYKVIRESALYSMLEINLFTGRKHQIRVQLADAGYPVAGDSVYGTKEKNVNRLALHASTITFRHPYTKKEMTFHAPAPPYFEQLMKQ